MINSKGCISKNVIHQNDWNNLMSGKEKLYKVTSVKFLNEWILTSLPGYPGSNTFWKAATTPERFDTLYRYFN